MIGTLKESSLHAALKRLYAEPGDELEAMRRGYVVDLVRQDELVEFQTGNFGSMRAKLAALLEEHRVRVVHPVAVETRILRIDGDGEVRSRRRSPVRGCHLSLFDELVSLPVLATHPSLTFETVLVRVEEHRVDAPRTRRRRKPWRVVDRVLVEVLETRVFGGSRGLSAVLPAGLASRSRPSISRLRSRCRATWRSGSPTRCGLPDSSRSRGGGGGASSTAARPERSRATLAGCDRVIPVGRSTCAADAGSKPVVWARGSPRVATWSQVLRAFRPGSRIPRAKTCRLVSRISGLRHLPHLVGADPRQRERWIANVWPHHPRRGRASFFSCPRPFERRR